MLLKAAEIARLPAGSYYLLENGRKLLENPALFELDPESTYEVCLRVLGGKGGGLFVSRFY